MNILIVGAGAVGSTIAVALARAGHDVTALLRPTVAPESGSLRMQVTPPTGEAQWAIVPTTTALTEQPDAVLLSVPAHAIAEASMTLAHLPATVPVVALHAAPAGDAVAGGSLGRGVIGGLFMGSAEYLAVGQARVAEGGLALDPALRAHPALFAALGAALPVTLAPVVPLRWARLLVDLPQAIGALADQPLSAIAGDRAIAAVALHLLTEATRALAAAAIVPADLPGVEMGQLRKLHTVPGLFAGNALRRDPVVFPGERALPIALWQRMRRRAATEVDALHGALLRLGQEADLPMPTHARLIEAVHTVTATGTFLALETVKRTLSRG